MIEFLGSLIGFGFFILIIALILKHKGTHPEIFELEEGEEIVEITKGDYWVCEFLVCNTQNSGEFAFTNKRILFKGTFLSSAGVEVKIPYSEIASIKKTFVMFFPVAFIVNTKDNKSYKFAMMKRDKFIDLINSNAKTA